MREMVLTLPTNDNEGRSLEDVHRQLCLRVGEEFEGYTRTPGFGGWLNPRTGELVEEECIVYTIAANPDIGKEVLRELGRWFGKEARQEAVYIKHQDATVEILDTSEAVSHVAAE